MPAGPPLAGPLARDVFDRSFLPPADLELVVLSDTHYMVDPGDVPLEFESRRKQTGRVEYALHLTAALGAPFIVHLGDIIQEYPGTDRYARALAEARAQLARHTRPGSTICHAPGNQDVGDKPDPTMPTREVTSASLAAYVSAFGPLWYSFDARDVHVVVLASSLLNAPRPERAAQRTWLEADLAAHRGARLYVFLHHPPYLEHEREPALGHYDNLGEPDRSWLLGLVRRYGVEALFAGHSHFAWFDRIDRTRYFVCPSTSFTRPGFGELFASPPAADHGRDDADKLGFYLVRVHRDGVRVHGIRTAGQSLAAPDAAVPQPPASSPSPASPRAAASPESPAAAASAADLPRRVLTRLPRDLPASPLGLTLSHPLAQTVEVPLAWPSVVRQRVRNDYPLLACLELGARHVRVPATDLDHPLQRSRLAVLRDEGVAVTATWLWHDRLAPVDLAAETARHAGLLYAAEVQLAGEAWPSERCLEALASCRAAQEAGGEGVTLSLAPVLPGERVAGKQLPRTRIGYRPADLPELDRRLAARDVRLERVACRIGLEASPWDAVRDWLALPPLSHVGAVDWLVALPDGAPEAHAARAAEAMFAAALAPGCRVFLEPLVDLDRTMDVSHGLLDRRCNPRPAFHAVRCLSTVLYHDAGTGAGVAVPGVAASGTTVPPPAGADLAADGADGQRVLTMRRGGAVLRLAGTVLDVTPAAPARGGTVRYGLHTATSRAPVPH